MSDLELRPISVSPNDDYMAGSDGQVYSRTRYKGFGRKDYVDWYPLAGAKSSRGYRTVTLCHENAKVTRAVHRLICAAFHGEPPSETHQVRHLDGDRSNNHPSNLAWGTQEENWQDRKAHGRGCLGEKHPMARFTDVEREHIRWAIAKGLCSQRQAARALGTSQGTISELVRSK